MMPSVVALLGRIGTFGWYSNHGYSPGAGSNGHATSDLKQMWQLETQVAGDGSELNASRTVLWQDLTAGLEALMERRTST
jgi:hypothetical protein